MKQRQRGPRSPFYVNTGLDDSKVVIQYPKDAIQIGTEIVDGNPQPVFVDPKDLIPTPDQKLEQADKMNGVSRAATLEDARWEIAARVEQWLGRCISQICPVAEKGQEAIKAWLATEGIDYVDDAPRKRFLLRRQGKVLSEFRYAIKSGVEDN